MSTLLANYSVAELVVFGLLIVAGVKVTSKILKTIIRLGLIIGAVVFFILPRL